MVRNEDELAEESKTLEYMGNICVRFNFWRNARFVHIIIAKDFFF